MDKDNCIRILKKELVPAMGCTEPIAIAYASAKAREVLGKMPEHVTIDCSGNIVKNVKGVTVPNSNGMKGLDVAAVLGVVGGDASKGLEVLSTVKESDIENTKNLIKNGYCDCNLVEGVENLFIVATVTSGNDVASVTLSGGHTNIKEIKLNGKVLEQNSIQDESKGEDFSDWSVKGILEFAKTVDISEVKPVLDKQIEYNTAISQEGMKGNYGAEVGKTILNVKGDNIIARAQAFASAGSDARMNGCAMPVIINSGSGNQGITVSVPVIEYAHELGVSEETLYRALLISNLISIYQKHFIGKLSAFCGAVTAACGSGAAITYMKGGDYEAICKTVINTICNVGGILCDGAKSSCAAKIASSVNAAILGSDMALSGNCFQPGEGLVTNTYEQTIRNIGYVGRVGMKSTDVEILNIMLDKVVGD